MKLIALIIAFACYADANAFVINDKQGTPLTVHPYPVTLLAVGFSSNPSGEMLEYNVRDCRKGKGDVFVYEYPKPHNESTRAYLGRLDWSTASDKTIDQIATFICATALAKAGLLK